MLVERGQRSKRGVSTLLATLMLTILVVVAGTLIYPYTMAYISASLTEPLIPSMQIQSIAEETEGLCVYVKNTGSKMLKLHDTLTNADLYINGVTHAYLIDEPYASGEIGEGILGKVIISPTSPDWLGKTNEL